MPDKTFSENPFDPAELRGIPVNKLKSANVPTPPDTISAKRITVLAIKLMRILRNYTRTA